MEHGKPAPAALAGELVRSRKGCQTPVADLAATLKTLLEGRAPGKSVFAGQSKHEEDATAYLIRPGREAV